MTDKEIQQAVLRELEWEPQVRSTEIGVVVKDGIVTLTGGVDSYSKRFHAERAAKRVAGVKAVVNDLEVHLPTSSERTDEDIASAVHDIVHWTVGLPDDSVKVQVEKGWVTLTGAVDWGYQAHIVARAISHMRGVRGVGNRIEVRSHVAPQDIGAQIARAMQRHADREVKHIGIDVKDGTVTLTGRVGSYAERAVARGAAWSAPGVRAVVDDLVVE